MPLTKADFTERLAADPLVLDGAMGTELERRGVETRLPLWSAGALRSSPEAVEEIHRAYVEAGADILVANTFRTNPRTLRRAGLEEAGPELNRTAVTLARRAAESASSRGLLVAASVGPVEDCYHPERTPGETELAEEHAQMMAWLRAADPDLVWIETIGTVREARSATRAAQAAGLPFVVSFLLREDGNLLGGEPLVEAVTAVEPSEPLALGLNCIPPTGMDRHLPRLRGLTALPLAAYAHINNPQPLPGWGFAESLSPEDYAAHALRWRAAGAALLGGCCGTTPAHIRALSRL